MGGSTAAGPAGSRAAMAEDGEWGSRLRFAGGCAGTFLVLLLTVDAAAGTLTGPRALLWTVLAALLLLVLVPDRVSARPGLLVSRGVLAERWVRTDRLVSVAWTDGVAQRLVLRDAEDGEVELDPRVLAGNPALWLLLDAGLRASASHGTLRCGTTALGRLADRVEGEAVRAVFKVSGLR
ncbi:hypothetical protein NX801_05125 [Streptomyces sp. LP05-1]|uniref:Integral membrane protein n=1 Tax=Streptomyces pyxinae TaxID=2970734 RepID=A0ABT2CCE5_9ACTN|nr:hypothetical protein [Streptomyces sp. LP05-1]MCS0635048.1 hypothetical protein [Streptomyces sp. LP05-1]